MYKKLHSKLFKFLYKRWIFLKRHFGLRTIKTVFAVFLCVVLNQLMPSIDLFFSATAAIVCMNRTKEKSLTDGIHRFVGTCYGGILGLMMILLAKNMPYYEILKFLIIPASIALIIILCNKTKKSNSIGISCIVALRLATSAEAQVGNSVSYVVNRVLDTAIGIAISVWINSIKRFEYTDKDDNNHHPKHKDTVHNDSCKENDTEVNNQIYKNIHRDNSTENIDMSIGNNTTIK